MERETKTIFISWLDDGTFALEGHIGCSTEASFSAGSWEELIGKLAALRNILDPKLQRIVTPAPDSGTAD